MSTPKQNARARRRIAGERKGRPVETTAPGDRAGDQAAPDSQPATPASGPPADEPTTGRATASAPSATPSPAPSATPSPAPAATSPKADAGTGLFTRPVPGWALLTLGVVAVLLVVLATGGLFLKGTGIPGFRAVSEQEAVAEAARTAPGAAERAAATILAYDYQSLDADRDAAARTMTADYRKEYLDTFDRLVRDNAEELKAQVTAEVKASGVTQAETDRVNVLLFVNQTTRSTAHEEPQIALNRVMLTMQRQDGRWLVDGITSY